MFRGGEQKPSRLAGWFFSNTQKYLDFRDVDSARSFWAFGHFKLDFVTFLEFFKGDALKLFRMKEKILVIALAGNEAESSVSQSFDCSLFHL